MRPDLCVVLGAVGLVRGSLRHAGPAMVEITKEINPYLVGDGFLADAPFGLLHGIIRVGTKFDPHAEVGPIDKRKNQLPFAVEVEMAWVNRTSKEVVKAEFLKALIPALFAIALEYELPVAGLTVFAESKGFTISKQENGDAAAL
jgi:Immunity protein 39